MVARNIHLLYAPTLFCNLQCSYCYLGEQTSRASLGDDAARAVATLEHTLAALREADVLAFNISLHGGEVTTLPPPVLEQLFALIQRHYLVNFDAINALGHRKSAPHIKTNLYKFAPLYELFDRHKVSISASIDLPLVLHARYRTTRGGESWLARTHDNIRLLARYPHAKKISATVSAEHLRDIPAFIDNIWFIHRELGFDMNQFNLMFAFASELNQASRGKAALTPATPQQQRALYAALTAEFAGTELADGLLRNWFAEFKPSYCTNAANCGERFYLLQGDGEVYSCVRGQGIEEFRYGNVFHDSVDQILQHGARKISAIHQSQGFDADCRSCGHLAICNTGCPVVKFQHRSSRSYTCELQRDIYRDHPLSHPASDAEGQRRHADAYAQQQHPGLAFASDAATASARDAGLRLPGELHEDRNALPALIAADPLLAELYSDTAFVLDLGDASISLVSQLLKPRSTWYTLAPDDRLVLHVRRSLFAANCTEPIRNTLYLQVLRDTPVVYGDEQRGKQEHLFTYQIYHHCLTPSDRLGPDWLMADLAGIVGLHRDLYRRGVLNNLFVSTLFLRDYHYQKQKNNAFYHVQAVNLPFQNVEFFYLPG
ncbi:MAG: radical SAM protein [Sulfuritalea sp.]|nr:radical SAM protein [Sulfuritalea sp.]MDP1982398.1 radical SAM protein [Sulfuritalea sp.]